MQTQLCAGRDIQQNQTALVGYWRDPLANAAEPLRLDTGRILGRIHRQGILSGILGIHWRATLGDPLAGCFGGILGVGGIHCELLWDTQRDTRRDPLAGCSGGILGGIHWRAALVGYSAGSTGERLWWDTRRDPLASCSGGILGGIHLRAALAGYSAGSTGELLWDTQQDTRRDPLASCSGGIPCGIHWRAALAGYWVGAWCRSIANADSNIKSNNPFLSGGETMRNPFRPFGSGGQPPTPLDMDYGCNTPCRPRPIEILSLRPTIHVVG